MNAPGYYRDPTVFEDQLAFVCEQDIWIAPLEGGVARRLTVGSGLSRFPCFSPDGAWIAFTGTEEGCEEVYVIPSQGGVPKRLTFLGGSSCQVVGWNSAQEVLFAASVGAPFQQRHIYKLDLSGGQPQQISVGPANFYQPAWGDLSGAVLQRHGYGYASWKRYRGGTAGEVWIDRQGEGVFEKLLSLEGNVLRPFWLKDRIYFLSDHESHGNVYSCTLRGDDIVRHTHHQDFYARNLQTNGHHLVYSAGGALWSYDLQEQLGAPVELQHFSPKPSTQRAFACPQEHLTSFSLNPEGNYLSLTTRGRLFRASSHKGPVFQHGEQDGVRYRLACWLHKGNRIIVVRDNGLEEVLEVYDEIGLKPLQVLKEFDWGRILEMQASPQADALLMTNHRHELCHFDMETQTFQVIDKSAYGEIEGFAWSPDGAWVAYGVHVTHKISVIRLRHIKEGTTVDITTPLGFDAEPSFDPEGKYLYFLSSRTFHPAWDALTFDLGFSKAVKPYLVTLQKETASPFMPPLVETEEPEQEDKPEEKEEGTTETKAPKPLKVDLEGIQQRFLEFPVSEGRYTQIEGLPKGKVLFLDFSEASHEHEDEDEEREKPTHCAGKLSLYDFNALKQETLLTDVLHFSLSENKQYLVYCTDKRLRVLKAGEKPEESDTSYKAGGWFDWARLRLSVSPPQEWSHMFDEAWRLQKELFWTKTMSHVDWEAVYRRYRPLVEAIATQEELIDLIADMQGELGSSHAYVWAPHPAIGPSYTLGQLGATFAFDPTVQAYRIVSFIRGDLWSAAHGSPLLKPGINLKEGDLIWAIAGQGLSANNPPEKVLVYQANQLVPLWVSDGDGQNKRMVYVAPLPSIEALSYRDWVDANRRYVHEKTRGRVGYLHVPDMSIQGFAEFHRGYLAEHHRDGLIVDVRFNRGGVISGLLLEKLARKRLGFDQTRWIGKVFYPLESPAGPMVALCNEYTASDGDMFSHSFKKMGLGPLIGKRTWGGVIGIFPRHPLLDGSMTTQPEYAFWFHDVGWSIENYGAEPDIVVEISPQDYREQKDTQLDRGITEVMQLLEKGVGVSGDVPGQVPDLSSKPLPPPR
ncbi:MAG: S41 family peptidase [Alphaproteobacteria bacterium]